MATISTQLTHLNTTKDLIRDAIIGKGVAVPEATPFRQYADKITAIPQEGGGGGPVPPSGDGWVRPADRPPVPTVNPHEIYMLFGVQPTGLNDYAITLAAVGGYSVDWGDGTTATVATNTRTEHMYDYASLAVTPNAEGIKWVWIKFNPVATGFTIINTNVRHSVRPVGSVSSIFVPQVYEMYLNAPTVTQWLWNNFIYTRFHQLEIFDWQGSNSFSYFSYFLCLSKNLRRFQMGTSNGTDFTYFLSGCSGFNQPLEIDTSNGTDFTYFLSGCSGFNQPLDIDTSSGTNFTSFLQSCTSFNQPLEIDTSRGTNFAYFLSGCSGFNQPLNINTSSGTNFTYFLSNCFGFNQPLDIDTSRGTNFAYFLSGCSGFNQPLNINTSSGTNFTYFLQSCNSFPGAPTVNLTNASTVAIGAGFIGTTNKAMTGLRLIGMRSIHSALTISYSALGPQDLADLFGDLYTRTSTSAGTITITGVAGASQLTPQQRAIATSKNWTIVG